MVFLETFDFWTVQQSACVEGLISGLDQPFLHSPTTSPCCTPHHRVVSMQEVVAVEWRRRVVDVCMPLQIFAMRLPQLPSASNLSHQTYCTGPCFTPNTTPHICAKYARISNTFSCEAPTVPIAVHTPTAGSNMHVSQRQWTPLPPLLPFPPP